MDLETLPLCVRAGAIVPMGPVKQYTGEAVEAPLGISVHPGAGGSFLLDEDGGAAFRCRNGEWMGIQMAWNDARQKAIGRRALGADLSRPAAQTLGLRLAAGSKLLPPARRDILLKRARHPNPNQEGALARNEFSRKRTRVAELPRNPPLAEANVLKSKLVSIQAVPERPADGGSASLSLVPVLFRQIGGTRGCRRLSKALYARIASDPLLRPLFPGKNLHGAIDEFAAFLVQLLGGPGKDSQRRWWLSLHESHRRFRIDGQHRDAWLRHMGEALQEAGIEEPARGALRNFFEHASAYLIDGQPDAPQMGPELARRWHKQRTVDDAVAAIRDGDANGAIRLAGMCDRTVVPGLLGLMIGTGDGALLRYLHQHLAGNPALAHARYAGRTLLHSAAAAGSLSTVVLLLRLGADPNALDGAKHTPLYCVGNECAGEESADIVGALVRAGARVDAQDGVTGATALHMAARRGNAVVAKALLDCGAAPHVRDRRGDTPLQRAVNCRKLHVAELLRSRSL